MERYSIYEGFIDDLRSKVKKVQNKCDKFGCDFHYEEVGEEYKEVNSGLDEKGNPIMVTLKFIIVEAEGTAQINGWDFVGSVEYTPNGNIFSKAMTDIEIPERYRTTKCICEHCNSVRARKDTFIILNSETGEFKQVGRNCLNDFTHGLSASTASWYMSIKTIFAEAEEFDASGFYMAHGDIYHNTRTVLQYIAETIRHFGYVKSDCEDDLVPTRATFDEIMSVDTGRTRGMHEKEIIAVRNKMESVGFDAYSEKATAMVDEALEWLANNENNNDYIHNLKVATSLEYNKSHRFGLLVSLFPSCNRALEAQAIKQKKEEESKLSEYVGSIGDRITIEPKEISCITAWESNYGYRGTTTYVWKILGTDGNIYTWKTSTWLNDEQLPASIVATVKEHKEFRDVKQTEITRGKVNS